MGYQDWWDSLTSHRSNEVRESFLKTYEVMFNPLLEDMPIPGCGINSGISHGFHQAGERKNELIAIDRHSFCEQLERLKEDDSNEQDYTFFKKIHLALARTQNIHLDNKTRIVFNLHTPSERRANFLIRSSLSYKILYSIREPHISAVSLYKHNREFGSPVNFLTVLAVMNTCYLPKLIETRAAAIRLEDLHLDSNKALTLVAKYCDIDFHENLTKSTFLGTTWHNLARTNDVTGFNTIIPNKRHKDLVSPEDEKRFEYIFQELYLLWGYREKKVQGVGLFSLLKRFKIEQGSDYQSWAKSRYLMVKIILSNNAFMRRILGKRRRVMIPLLQ